MRSTYDYYDRGSIFFETKDGDIVSAATLKSGFILTVHPDEAGDATATCLVLEGIVSLDRTECISKVSKKGDPEERLANRLNKDTADKISALGLPGIHLVQERWRFYPGGEAAAHAVGFIGYDKNDDVSGRYGLERFYEDTLGRNNKEVYANFFVEVFSGIKKVLSSEEELEGDIVTTIEPSVESFLEKKLGEVQAAYSSDYSGGIIMDPYTGEIYAMAIVPTFDPNDLKKEKSVDVFQNKLVENVFEMGSIIKPLTMAAALDVGAITPKTTYYDAGSVVLDGKKISNFDGRGRGTATMQDVLNNSLNTGMVFVMQKMGSKTFAEYMKNYGLGQETGIDLPNEIHGLIDNLNSPREVEYATAAFGQGIALTPFATIRALAALGNGGVLPDPHLVKKINYRLGGGKSVTPNPENRVLKTETSETITGMLVKVVDEALLGGSVKIPDHSVAAKTGTAQVVKDGSYSEDRYLHSFFGYFPAYHPRFIVFLFTMHPKGVKYASETLTHPFMDITKFLINYYEIPPDRGTI